MTSDHLDVPLAIAPVARLGRAAAAAPDVAAALGYDIAAAGKPGDLGQLPAGHVNISTPVEEPEPYPIEVMRRAVPSVWLDQQVPVPGQVNGPSSGPAYGATPGSTPAQWREVWRPVISPDTAGRRFCGTSRPEPWTAIRKAPIPTWWRSSAAIAVTIPTGITGRSRPGFSWSAGPTRSQPALPHTSRTSACTTSRRTPPTCDARRMPADLR
jgi:hypothetical protein